MMTLKFTIAIYLVHKNLNYEFKKENNHRIFLPTMLLVQTNLMYALRVKGYEYIF